MLSYMGIEVFCGLGTERTVGNGRGEGSGAAVGNEAELVFLEATRMDLFHVADELLTGLHRDRWVTPGSTMPSCAMLRAHMCQPLLAGGVKLVWFRTIFEHTDIRVEVLLDVLADDGDPVSDARMMYLGNYTYAHLS
jgi:hypothetical protein